MQRPPPPPPAPLPSPLDVPDATDPSRWPPGALGLAKSGLDSPSSPPWASRDPRTSSTQSLVSSKQDIGGAHEKRTLLVVYIHGFMGNNSSFRSFPAHVHSFLKGLLAETHTIHTKIYPRYKTYKSIDVACDNFSKWLEPHESPATDVVLIGHSMGGLLAAEVVLLPNRSPYNLSSPFRHRILGTISLDAPLIGLHPGIVVSGIASLFRPAPSPPPPYEATRTDYVTSAEPQKLSPKPSIYSDVSPVVTPSPSLMPYPTPSTLDSSARGSRDPYFDPPFVNDVAFVDRGWLKNVIHFAAKHKEENLVSAAANHIMSHLEFGSCLADYPELRSRYSRLRQLEDVDNSTQAGAPRVRFVNYFTVSTGVPKKPKPASPNGSPEAPDMPEKLDIKSSLEIDSQISTSIVSTEDSPVPTPRASAEECSDNPDLETLQILDPMPEPEPESSEPPSKAEDNIGETEDTTADASPLSDDDITNQDDLALPPIPDVPSPPTPPDFDAYPDKEARKDAKNTFKLAQKAHAQAVKARDKAIKNRDKALKDRDKAARDHQKALDKQQRKALKLKEKEAKKLQDKADKDEEKKLKKTKPLRRRKFCMLPGASGDDPTWVEVYMEGVDEVGAHCGLFLPGPHYEPLVGGVGERIAGWVWEDASRRAVVGMEDEGPSSG